jgi:hypothetical protein
MQDMETKNEQLALLQRQETQPCSTETSESLSAHFTNHGKHAAELSRLYQTHHELIKRERGQN